MRQQVLRSGPNGENISVGRIEIEKGSRVLWKRKRGRGYSKSVVLVVGWCDCRISRFGARGQRDWSWRLGHTGTAYGGRAHLGQNLVQPLQGAVQVKLDPAWGARHCLPSTQQQKTDGSQGASWKTVSNITIVNRKIKQLWWWIIEC